MSDSNSDSSESDNNNLSPIFNHYLTIPYAQYQFPSIPRLEIEYSSSNESNYQYDEFETSSSDNNNVTLRNTSEESNYGSDDSRSSLVLPIIKERNNITAPIQKKWCFTKELYNREIGNYKNKTAWSNKFYQSVFAVQKLKLNNQLKGHEGCVNSLDFNKTGNLLVSGSDDLKIYIWDWSKGKPIQQYQTLHKRNIFQTKFLNSQGNNHTIVSSSRDGLIVLSIMNTLGIIYNKIITSHTRSCNKLGVHRDEPNVFLSCGEDGVIKNIDIRESPINENANITNILRLQYDTGGIIHLYGIDVNPMNSMEFIVNGDDEYVRMYDKRNLSSEPIKKFCGIPNPELLNDDGDYFDDHMSLSSLQEAHITSAVYNYCGTEILASYSEDDVYLFDVNGPPETYLHHYSGHLNRATIKGVNFYGPQSDYVISGSDCGYIFIWDKKTEAILLRKHADVKGAVNVLESHPFIPVLATSGLDNTVKIWEPLNSWQQPNKKKLKMAVIKNKSERVHITRRIPFSSHEYLRHS